MKQILLVLAIGLLSMTTQAQTRTFNTQVRLNNLAEPTGDDDILVINSENKVSSVPKSDLFSEPTAQTLSLSGNDLSIAGGNTVTLPTSGGSGEALQTESGTFTTSVPGEFMSWTGYGSFYRIGNLVTYSLSFDLTGTLQGKQPFRTFTDILPYRAVTTTAAASINTFVAVKDNNRNEFLQPNAFVSGKRISVFFSDLSGYNQFGDDQSGSPWSNVYFGELDASIIISGSYITDEPFN